MQHRDTWENKYHVTKRARYWSDGSISQGMPRIASNKQKPGKNMEQILHLRPQEKINPADALISDIGPPELQKKISVVLSYQVCSNLLWQPEKTNTST